jgi:hypothetical protein
VTRIRQIKQLLHGLEGLADADATDALTEEVRQPLAASIAKAFVPVTHTIRTEPESAVSSIQSQQHFFTLTINHPSE